MQTNPEEMMFFVQLEDGVFMAGWDGDPGRTLDFNVAKEYATIAEAIDAIKRARQYRPFPNARIIHV
jgi:hypothetical protein